MRGLWRRRRQAVVLSCGVLASLCTPLLTAHATQASQFVTAEAYAESQATVGMALLDRQTGAYQDNGILAHQPIPSASVIKMFVAEDLLDRDRHGTISLTDSDNQLIRNMIIDSDDDAMSWLYFRYGADQIIENVEARYGLSEITRPPQSGYWGYYGLTAHDVVAFYDGFLSGGLQPEDSDYLVSLMRQAAPTGADGFDQTFGIPSALPGQVQGIKQGWNCCLDNRRELHTTGILGADDRYILVVLSQYDSGQSYSYASDTVTHTVQLLFPGGQINQTGSVHRGLTRAL